MLFPINRQLIFPTQAVRVTRLDKLTMSTIHNNYIHNIHIKLGYTSHTDVLYKYRPHSRIPKLSTENNTMLLFLITDIRKTCCYVPELSRY